MFIDSSNYYVVEENADKTFNNIMSNIIYSGGPKDIEFEIIPKNGSEREAYLPRIKTEMMSGEGPDVFPMACCPAGSPYKVGNLFPMPEKAMKSGCFMVLDEYMESYTELAEWDKMTRIVLGAGKNEEEQQIIPLCYRIPATVYSVKEVEHTPSKEITWMDMLESEDEAFAAAALWTDMDVFAATWNTVKDDLLFTDLEVPMIEFVLGELADYKQEKLLFTEEKLRLRIEEICVLADNYLAGQYDSAPTHYCGFPGHNFNMNKNGADEE